MFLTYGFLHNGPSHMIVNMLTLWTAGEIVIDRVGSKGFLRLYAVSIVGGASVTAFWCLPWRLYGAFLLIGG